MRIPDGIFNFGSKLLSEVADEVKNVERAAVKVEQTAQKVATGLAQDVFELGVTLPDLERLLPGSPPTADMAFDGLLVGANGTTYPPSTPLANVPAVTPQGGVRNGETVLFVNGAGLGLSSQETSMQDAANATGSRVVGIHNATDGLPVDALQTIEDIAGVGKDRAVDTLAKTVYSEIEAGHAVHIMAHSQGAAQTSRALDEVRARLIAGGLSPQQAQAKLSQVKVETFGGATFHYPNGPKYVHYVNRADIVPTFFGLGWDNDPRHAWAGAGAVIREFTDAPTADLLGPHAFDTTYLKHWQPFDQVYPSGTR